MNAITHSRKWHKGQTAFATPKIIHDPQAAYRAGWQDAAKQIHDPRRLACTCAACVLEYERAQDEQFSAVVWSKRNDPAGR
jgi:hypothetical protein